MIKIPFVDLQAQHRALRAEIEPAMQAIITDCNFILGAPVVEFENAFARFVEVKHAVGVGNGLDALRLSLEALDICPGDEVIVPANTYIATALAVTQCKANVRLVDCDAATLELDAGLLEKVITPKTKAIIPVHLTGQAADMDPILAIAKQHKLHVIEDAAQAHGTLYKKRPCGSIGTMGCFSFYPGKNLGGCGDGGLITTNDDKLAERLRSLRNYGQRVKYEHVELGGNSRLDTLQAAILSIKLRKLPDWNEARYRHAQRYRELLKGVGDLEFQTENPDSTHIYHLFIVQSLQRDQLQRHLTAAGIETGIHYPIPIHRQAAYKDLNYSLGMFPVAERLAGRMLSLPMFPELTEAQITRVTDSIREYFGDNNG